MSRIKNKKLILQQYVYNKVSNVDDVKKYKSRVEQLAMLVYTNSLISAVAVIEGSNEASDKALSNHIRGWLKHKEVNLIQVSKMNFVSELLVNDISPIQMRWMTREVLLFADAAKEMAKSLL